MGDPANAARRFRIEERLEKSKLWPVRFPADQWRIYRFVMSEAQARGIPFAIGGGLASTTYAGQWRNSKDIDFYIQFENRDRMIQVLTNAGLGDYYDRKSYDRKWIYRSCKDETIVDIMWGMANQRATVDEKWLAGPEVKLDDLKVRLLPPEETLWSKLYVLQHDRCDWSDALSILYSVGPELNWPRLLERVGEDHSLLRGLLSVFQWVSPGHAAELPEWVWSSVGLPNPETDGRAEPAHDRAALLDSRPWLQPASDEESDGLETNP